MADRPCDCLHPKSALCSCQHCQWFCAGRDAIVIRQATVTWPKRHLPNAYEVLLTRYISFALGGSLSVNISRGRGHHPPTNVGVRILKNWLTFCAVSKYPQPII